ncbi:MAG: Fic family protein [bacterium]|nr:Fic family protein [bacterium]
MYSPKFTITNEILKNISTVEACREVIDNAPLVPAWEKRFRDEAANRTVHYGTHLEGNDLSLSEAVKVMEGQNVVGRERDIQEVINYRKVLDYIDRQQGIMEYTPLQLKKIQSLTVDKLKSPAECGKYRTTGVVLRNSKTGEISFKPPSFSEVPKMVDDFFLWLNSDSARNIHPVIRAAIVHYVLAAIHPFVEGNGRTARAFANLILFSEGYNIKRFFSLEENFDKDTLGYFGCLMHVSNMHSNLESRDLTPWIEYFSKVLSIELVRIKEKVKKLSVDLKLKGRLGKQIALSERQMKMVEYLEEYRQLTVSQTREILRMVSDDTILRDLKDLVKKGILKKEGKTKAAKYIMRG